MVFKIRDASEKARAFLPHAMPYGSCRVLLPITSSNRHLDILRASLHDLEYKQGVLSHVFRIKPLSHLRQMERPMKRAVEYVVQIGRPGHEDNYSALLQSQAQLLLFHVN
jgi:hypothetical protein